MQTETLMKKKPAALTQPSAGNRALFQGGDGSRLATGQPGSVGLRAHNGSLLAQQQPAHQCADGHRREDEQQDGENGVHVSVLDVEWVLNLAPTVTHHAGNPVEAPADVGEQQHLGLRGLGCGLRADQLGRQVPASDGGLNSVPDGVGKFFRPLTNSRARNADCFGGGCHGSAEQVNGLRFIHLVRLAR